MTIDRVVRLERSLETEARAESAARQIAALATDPSSATARFYAENPDGALAGRNVPFAAPRLNSTPVQRNTVRGPTRGIIPGSTRKYSANKETAP